VAKPAKKAEKKTEGELVVPEHGRGKIWQGAPANPVAGTGRPPSAIREQLRGSFSERVKILEKIADGIVTLRLVGCCEECGHEGEPLTADEIKAALPQIADRIKAIDMLAKYGLGTRQEVTGPDGEALFKVYRNIDDEDV
jgi:hypothetical protein